VAFFPPFYPLLLPFYCLRLNDRLICIYFKALETSGKSKALRSEALPAICEKSRNHAQPTFHSSRELFIALLSPTRIPATLFNLLSHPSCTSPIEMLVARAYCFLRSRFNSTTCVTVNVFVTCDLIKRYNLASLVASLFFAHRDVSILFYVYWQRI